MIRVNVKGKVLKGEKHEGWYIVVEPTGSTFDAYYILYSIDFDFRNSREGYDDLVQDFEALEDYFKACELEVQWLEGTIEKTE